MRGEASRPRRSGGADRDRAEGVHPRRTPRGDQRGDGPERRFGLLSPLRLGSLALFVSAAVSGPLAAQTDEDSVATTSPFEPEGFGTGPSEEMRALLEVTLFNIDVLTLTIRVAPETGTRLHALVDDREEYDEALADSVAAVMLGVEDAWARQVFERDVSFGRLTGGMLETAEKAAEAGWVSGEYVEEFAVRLPGLFGFLEERGAKEGDSIYFWLRGDEVRTVYQTVDGAVLLDELGVSAEGRLASIPSFFAPGTRFRKRLVESLLQGS